MLTIMGIAARKAGIAIEGARANVVKEMVAAPVRRILEIDTPAGAPQRLLVWLDPCGDGVLFGVQPLET